MICFEESPKLGEVDKEAHHTLVAKLLFVAKHARLDILMPDHNCQDWQEQIVTFAQDDWYPLRYQKPSSYGHIHVGLEDIMMTQYPVKKGFKVFGKKGSDAVVLEMQQLHNMEVSKPKHANMLLDKEKR